MFTQRSRSVIYEDKWCTFYKDEVEFSEGTEGTHTVLARASGVAVLVVTKNQEVLLIKQYRYPVQSYEWELPGGGIDEGETMEEAAKREVKEESGLTITHLEQKATYLPLSSAASEKCTLFIAEVDIIELPEAVYGKDEEIREIKVMPLADALEMVITGEITDPFTGQALLLYDYIQNKKKVI